MINLKKYSTSACSIVIKFFIFCNVFHFNCALYEDQVGKFDWRQQYIGNVIAAHFEHNVGSHKIIVATEENVIAALNPRTNQTIWRQVLEAKNTGKVHGMVSSGNDVLSINGDQPVIRSWDTNTGILNWETSLVNSPLNRFQTSYYQFRTKTTSIIVAECQPQKSVNLKSYNYLTGELINSQNVPAPWFSNKSKCLFTSGTLFICLEGEIVYTLDLDRDSSFLPSTLGSLGLLSGDTIELMTLGEESSKKKLLAFQNPSKQVVLVEKTDGGLNVIQKFANVASVTSATVNDELVVLILLKQDKEYVLKALNTVTGSYLDEISGSLSYPDHHGAPVKMFVDVLHKKDGGILCRVLLTTSSHSLLYFNAGAVQWSREESLASIVSVEIVELPMSESDAGMEEQFGNVNANIMVLFLKRLTTQLLNVQTFLTRLLLNTENVKITSDTDSANLIRDEFDIHKMIVAATSTGKIFGLDSNTGKIIWQHLVVNLRPFQRYDKPYLPLYVLRTTARYSYSPLCALIGTIQGETVIYTFNPISGEAVGIHQFNYRMVQALQMSAHDSDFIRGILIMDSNYKIHVFPTSCSDVASQLASSCFMFIGDVEKGELKGFNLGLSSNSEELIANQVWSLVFQAESQRITNVVMKRSDEHVHSQGRVMGDRSVLYKYLNPNLAVVTCETAPGHQQSSLNVHLVDVVSGQIVFSANHKRAKGPMHIVHSENWVVYSYTSEKSRRIEVSVLELYEGKTQSNTTHYSSLSPPPPPMVERQAYIFYTQIDSLSVTITQKGITAKHILVALPGGGILELPKTFLDPRRSLFPTAQHREEGIIPYNPELPVHPGNIINYNQSLFRVRNIYTVPTGLESTCLVLAYGLDLFYTRVTPSRTFDVLKEDFDHWIIVMALTGLLVASYVSKRFAAKKALKQAWK